MFLEILGAVGGGAAFGAVITKSIDAVVGRNNRKADAAKALTEAEMQFTEAVSQLNVNLHKEISVLRQAILSLTDAVDEILPHIEGLTDIQRERLRAVNNAAKLAI
jgi:hypothetical protein